MSLSKFIIFFSSRQQTALLSWQEKQFLCGHFYALKGFLNSLRHYSSFDLRNAEGNGRLLTLGCFSNWMACTVLFQYLSAHLIRGEPSHFYMLFISLIQYMTWPFTWETCTSVFPWRNVNGSTEKKRVLFFPVA